jgi:hypothetical protein
MDLAAFLKNYAEQIGGQYTEYTASQSIIIVPVSGGRFQTIVATIKKNELYNRQLINLLSKICQMKPDVDLRMLLEQTAFFNYCRFTISENHLQIEAVTTYENATEDQLKEMIQEVANLADQFEMKVTGADIH